LFGESLKLQVPSLAGNCDLDGQRELGMVKILKIMAGMIDDHLIGGRVRRLHKWVIRSQASRV
jgi:hypothetical protein